MILKEEYCLKWLFIFKHPSKNKLQRVKHLNERYKHYRKFDKSIKIKRYIFILTLINKIR